MRIGILTTVKNGFGGVERFTTYFERGFIERGYEVVVIDRSYLSRIAQALVTVSKFFALQPIVLGYFLGRVAQQQDLQVLVTNGLFGWNVTNQRVRIINVQHGTYARSAERIDKGRNWVKYSIKRWFWGPFEQKAAQRADVCVAVSEETKESVERYYGVTDAIVIPNAVDTDFFKPLPNVVKKNQAIFVGRFEFAKGKDILVGMQQYLAKKGWQLMVAESVSQEDLQIVYNESQVFLLPSLQEGCSYSLLEAIACGVPFLASPVGLVSEFATRQLFPQCIVIEQNLESYIAAFERLVNRGDSALGSDLRTYAVKQHSLTVWLDSYEKILK